MALHLLRRLILPSVFEFGIAGQGQTDQNLVVELTLIADAGSVASSQGTGE